MENSDFINLMKQQQEMISNQQAQISQLLEMQQRQNMENERKQCVEDTNPTYEREVEYQENDYKHILNRFDINYIIYCIQNSKI